MLARGFFGALLLALLLHASLRAIGAPAGDRRLESFTATDLKGERWDADRLSGKVVLFDFWATWCTPCIAQLPTLRRLHEKFGPQGFEILSVSVDTLDRRSLRSFLRLHDMPWHQFHDGRGLSGPVPRSFGVEVVPTSLLYDRRGRLLATDLNGEALEAALEALFASE